MLTHAVREDVEDIRVGVVGRLPDGVLIEGLRREGQRTGVGLHLRMLPQETVPLFLRGDGLPLGRKFSVRQGDGRIAQHLPDGVVVAQGDGHHRELVLHPVVEVRLLRQVQAEGAVAGHGDMVPGKVRRDLVIVVVGQVRLLIHVVIPGEDLHIVHGALVQVSGGPPHQDRRGDEQKDGQHQGHAGQRHRLTGDAQLGDDLPEEEQVFSLVAVLRLPLLPRHEKAAGEIEQGADQEDQIHQDKEQVLIDAPTSQGQKITAVQRRHAGRRNGIQKGAE